MAASTALAEAIAGKKTALFGPLILLQNRSFYQDRLRTDIGKALKKRPGVVPTGMDLDAALASYPCTPCNYAVADLDDLDPAAEESLGAALVRKNALFEPIL